MPIPPLMAHFSIKEIDMGMAADGRHLPKNCPTLIGDGMIGNLLCAAPSTALKPLAWACSDKRTDKP